MKELKRSGIPEGINITTQKKLSLIFASVPELGNAIVPERFIGNHSNDNDCYFHSIGFLLGGITNHDVKNNLLSLWDSIEGLKWLNEHAGKKCRTRLEDIKIRLQSYEGALGVYEETFTPLVEKYYNVVIILYVTDDDLTRVIMSTRSKIGNETCRPTFNILLVPSFSAFMPIVKV